jgi:hypothetical protein
MGETKAGLDVVRPSVRPSFFFLRVIRIRSVGGGGSLAIHSAAFDTTTYTTRH